MTSLGFVIIGRNEGERLAACLASIPASDAPVVYADSASTDDSVETARAAGSIVVELDPGLPLSAARARNEGFLRLKNECHDLEYVHFVDGDSVLLPDWIGEAMAEFARDSRIVAVCGRRREQSTSSSIYNRICDVEWCLPREGIASSFGGEVIIRVDAFEQAGGYDDEVIAGEDTELATRLRAGGGSIFQLGVTASLHDAGIRGIGQWLRRAVRCGHAYAQVGHLQEGLPEPVFARARLRTWWYGGVLPALTLALAPASGGLSLLLLGLYGVQTLRLVRLVRSEGVVRDAWPWSIACVAAQPANLLGMLLFHLRSRTARGVRIIEYKQKT